MTNLLVRINNPEDYVVVTEFRWVISHYEGFGMVLNEALAEGVPILLVDCPNVPAEIIENGKYGKLVTSYDLVENVNAFLEFLDEENKPREFYQQRALDFEIKKCAQNYLDLVFNK